MRSLHIDTAQTWRGGQNQVWQLVTGLQERGQPTVLLGYEGGELHRRAREGVRFVGFTPRSEFDVHAGWLVARVLGDVKPDVVHAHDAMGVSLAAMALQMSPRLAPRPLLVASRRVDFHLKSHAFSKWKYRQIDLFIAASHVIAASSPTTASRATTSSSSTTASTSGLVDKEPVVDAHGTFWLPKGVPLVGNVAALAPHKGQQHLVAAAAARRPRSARHAVSDRRRGRTARRRSSGRSRISGWSVTSSFPAFATTRWD